MLKSILTTLILIPFLGISLAYSQCVPGLFNTPGFYPDSATGLPNACVNNQYNEVLTIVVPYDTLISGFTLHFDSLGVTNIIGLPSGFSYVTNPSSGYWLGGNSGCILITGTNGTIGTYPLTIHMMLTTLEGVSIPYTIDDYKIIITANVLPNTPGIIQGPNFVCNGSTNITYFVPSVPDATDYIWTLPNGATIISGQNTNNILVNYASNALSGNITVAGSNSCGIGQSSALAVTIISSPVANAGNSQSASSGTSVTLNGSATGGSGNYSYSWVPSGLLQNANVQNPTTVALANTTVFTLVVTDNVSGCEGSDNVQITVGGNFSGLAGANPASVCPGGQTTLLVIPSGGSGTYTYVWSSNPAGFSSTLQNPTVTPTVSTLYTVTISDGSQTTTASVSVFFSSIPAAAGSVFGPSSVNQGESGISYSVSIINNATSYIWTLPQGINIVSGQNTHSIVVNFTVGATSGIIKVHGSNSCGDGINSPDFPVTVLTDIKDIPAFTLHLQPNPSNGAVTVEMNNSPNDKLTMKVYNIVGEIVFEAPLNNELRQSFTFSDFADGLYYVHILGNKYNIAEKLIIQKKK